MSCATVTADDRCPECFNLTAYCTCGRPEAEYRCHTCWHLLEHCACHLWDPLPPPLREERRLYYPHAIDALSVDVAPQRGELTP
jgi:hypothetical protein